MLSYELCKKHPRNNKGETHPSWKAGRDKVPSLHQWFTRRYGRPTPCEHCGDIGHEEKDGRWSIQRAKKTESKYTRNLEDYLNLCRSCHRKYDMTEKEKTRLTQLANNQSPEQRAKLSAKRKINSLTRKRDERGHFIKA